MLSFLSEVTRKRGIVRNSLILFSAEDALAVLDEGEANGQELLGVDGFKLSGATIQPFLEHSLDVSAGEPAGGDRYTACRNFIKQRADLGLSFELVFQ